MDLKEKIGKTIKERRKQLGMEQVDLQDYADVSPVTVSKLEQGKLNITIEKLESIIDVLGLELIIKVKETV